MKMRPEPSVLWREGMFLLPQHLQAFTREISSRITAGDAVGRVGNYGLLSLDILEASLQNDVFGVERAEEEQDFLLATSLAHQTDSPDLASQRSKPATDLDSVPLQQGTPERFVIDPVGDPHRGELRQSVRLVHQ